MMGQYSPCARANAANLGTLDSFVIIHVLAIAKISKLRTSLERIKRGFKKQGAVRYLRGLALISQRALVCPYGYF